jgi:hypothetical protein
LNFLGDPLRVSDPDPHQSEKADPDPHRSQKQDPNSNLHQHQLSVAVEAPKEAMEGLDSHIKGLETQNRAVDKADRNLHQSEKRDTDPQQNGLKSNNGILLLK